MLGESRDSSPQEIRHPKRNHMKGSIKEVCQKNNGSGGARKAASAPGHVREAPEKK